MTHRWFLPLTPQQLSALMLRGDDAVAGAVLPETDADFADADAVRRHFAHPEPAPGAGRFADYLLLPDQPGIVVDEADETWTLRATRTPTDTELWRMEDDGTRILITYYDTPAFGWRNSRGPVSPVQHVGPRARWTSPETGEQMDLVAAFEDGVDGVHLVAVSDPGDDPPAGFTWTKLGVSRRTVALADVELYDAATGEPVTA